MSQISFTGNTLAECIYFNGDELRTDSLKVAMVFNKLHKNILRDIKELFKVEPEFAELNYELCYKNNELQNGKLQPYYQMTKDGFIFLVMGFTGAVARKIKIAYIDAFNRRQRVLSSENNTLIRRFFRLVEKENQSFEVASAAGKVLQSRKYEKENNLKEMEYLQRMIQPDLFSGHKNGALIGLAASQNSLSGPISRGTNNDKE